MNLTIIKAVFVFLIKKISNAAMAML